MMGELVITGFASRPVSHSAVQRSAVGVASGIGTAEAPGDGLGRAPSVGPGVRVAVGDRVEVGDAVGAVAEGCELAVGGGLFRTPVQPEVVRASSSATAAT